jgi:hypothetical protein
MKYTDDTKPGDTWGDGTPKITLNYVVTWWERDASGYPIQRRSDHRSADEARMAFRRIEPDQEPGAIESRWDPSTRKWHHADIVGRSVPREQLRTARAHGIAMVRAVLAHKRGIDTRGASTLGESIDLSLATDDGKTDKLNARGHNHFRGADNCPVCSRLVAEDDPAQCTVCDYLCEHGHEPVHPFASLQRARLAPRRPVSF